MDSSFSSIRLKNVSQITIGLSFFNTFPAPSKIKYSEPSVSIFNRSIRSKSTSFKYVSSLIPFVFTLAYLSLFLLSVRLCSPERLYIVENLGFVTL